MAKRPNLGEIASDDHGIAMTRAYTATLLDNPDTVLAQRGRDLKIYDEMLRDDQVKSTFQQRRSAVTSCDWEIEPASESAQDTAIADFISEQIKAINWDEITDKMLYGVYYGIAVAEVLWKRDGSTIGIEAIKVRDRARFKFDTRGDLRLINQQHPQGLLLPPRKFWHFSAGATHSDNPYGLGLAHSLYWPVFFKRNDIKFWLIFLEKFGMPTSVGRIPGGKIDNPAEVQKALRALQAIQTDSAVVIPEDMTIELIEAARSGTADYAELYERMDKAIAKVVLSQTMTTDDGSSRSQAEVHKGVAEWVIKSDADLLSESFNRQVIAWLTEYNFPGATPPRLWRNTEPPEDLYARAERDEKISRLGYEPTEDYITETYGPGWRKKAEPVTPPANPGAELGPEFQEISALIAKKAGHRADQQALIDAAEYLSTQYNELYGKRIEQILAYLDETSDLETFREHLTSLLAEAPSEASVNTVRNATWYARLAGRLRGQREGAQ